MDKVEVIASMTSADLEQALKEAGVGIQRVLETKHVPAVAAGENYTSDISRTSLKVLKDDGTTETLHVIIKDALKDKLHTPLLEEIGLFRMEIMMYTEVFPNMEVILEKQLKDAETLWPRCLGTSGYDKVILEDLKPHGYKMADRIKGLDLDHALFVLQHLARFHAVSVVLHDAGMLDVSTMNKYFLAEDKYSMNKQVLHKNFIDLSAVVRESWGPEWSDTSARLLKVAHEFLERSSKVCALKESSFHVLNHGDLWVNNFLFKYHPKSGDIQSIKFIDFQLSHFNTPSVDLQYFFHMALSPELKEDHYDELLQVYHSALLENFKSFAHTPKNLFSLAELKKDMEDKMYVGFLATVVLMPFILSNRGEGVDLEEIVKHNDSTASKNLFRGKVVEERLQRLLPKFLEKGLL